MKLTLIIGAFNHCLQQYYSSSEAFSCTKKIRLSRVNYAEIIADPHNDNFICKCNRYPLKYKNAHQGHILTRGTSIVEHKDLRALLCKCLGNHDQQPPKQKRSWGY